jgi:hypothetical protein
MTGFFNFPRSATVAAGSLLAILAICGTAKAVTDTIFKYSAPKTGYFTIDHMAMAPDGDGADYTISWGDGLFLNTMGSRCFNTGVNLPNGAKITAAAVYYASGMGAPIQVNFDSHKFVTGAVITIGSKNLTDNSSTRKVANLSLSSTPADLVINNAQSSYGFGVCLSTTDNVFFGARITYTYDNAGD